MHFKRAAFIYGVATYQSVKPRSAARANNYVLDAHAMEIESSPRAHYDVSRDHPMKDKEHPSLRGRLQSFRFQLASLSFEFVMIGEGAIGYREACEVQRPTFTGAARLHRAASG
jgi:hypothetical protein